MDKYTKIFLVILSIIVLIDIFTDKKTNNNDILYYRIERKIDSLRIIERELNKRLEIIDSNVIYLNNQITSIDKNINIIKKNTDEQIASVDTFTNNELQQFFTKRYNPNISK